MQLTRHDLILSSMIPLKLREGFSAAIYRDTTGHQTIGYGTNLDMGITPSQGEALAYIHLRDTVLPALEGYDWWAHLGTNKRLACMDMAYQMGARGFHGFVKMRAAIELGDDEGVIREMEDSEWGRTYVSRRMEVQRQWRAPDALDAG